MSRKQKHDSIFNTFQNIVAVFDRISNILRHDITLSLFGCLILFLAIDNPTILTNPVLLLPLILFEILSMFLNTGVILYLVFSSISHGSTSVRTPSKIDIIIIDIALLAIKYNLFLKFVSKGETDYKIYLPAIERIAAKLKHS